MTQTETDREVARINAEGKWRAALAATRLAGAVLLTLASSLPLLIVWLIVKVVAGKQTTVKR